ncbi:helix-turn-helix domain-containing protein [Microvirga alba]|uniref:Helix-turn-helix domain-containing protein n=1 Tax=Microvirga alba TaxID=2791025 RepID=A0A931BVE6_9HYPH|nr:helix-turn-helix domain-containing protein [Microvirga alba]MBF9235428.1 helix-turn-helix domain-containing protein [Microvirga alba]
MVNYPSDLEPLELGPNYTNERMAWHELVLRDPLLKPSEKVIAGLIMHMIRRELGYAYPAIETMAEEGQLSRSTVKRALDQLRGLGWICTEEVGRNKSLRYYLSHSGNRRALIEEARRVRRIERKVRREERGPRLASANLVGPPVTLLKAHGRTFARVIRDPAGGAISEPQTQLQIPANVSRLRSNPLERAAGNPAVDVSGHAIAVEAGLPEEEIFFQLNRHLEGWWQVPTEKKHAAACQVAARGLTREEASELAEALGCQLRGRSF